MAMKSRHDMYLSTDGDDDPNTPVDIQIEKLKHTSFYCSV